MNSKVDALLTAPVSLWRRFRRSSGWLQVAGAATALIAVGFVLFAGGFASFVAGGRGTSQSNVGSAYAFLGLFAIATGIVVILVAVIYGGAAAIYRRWLRPNRPGSLPAPAHDASVSSWQRFRHASGWKKAIVLAATLMALGILAFVGGLAMSLAAGPDASHQDGGTIYALIGALTFLVGLVGLVVAVLYRAVGGIVRRLSSQKQLVGAPDPAGHAAVSQEAALVASPVVTNPTQQPVPLAVVPPPIAALSIVSTAADLPAQDPVAPVIVQMPASPMSTATPAASPVFEKPVASVIDASPAAAPCMAGTAAVAQAVSEEPLVAHVQEMSPSKPATDKEPSQPSAVIAVSTNEPTVGRVGEPVSLPLVTRALNTVQANGGRMAAAAGLAIPRLIGFVVAVVALLFGGLSLLIRGLRKLATLLWAWADRVGRRFWVLPARMKIRITGVVLMAGAFTSFVIGSIISPGAANLGGSLGILCVWVFPIGLLFFVLALLSGRRKSPSLDNPGAPAVAQVVPEIPSATYAQAVSLPKPTIAEEPYQPMAAAPDIVTLLCPACGGKLQITNDLERFACMYCGSEHMVRRSGGLVSLAPMVQGLKQVAAGVDKTASELAIVRLRGEIAQLEDEQRRYLSGVFAINESGANALVLAFRQMLKSKKRLSLAASGQAMAAAFRDASIGDVMDAVPLIKKPLWGDSLQRAQIIAQQIIDRKKRLNKKQLELRRHEQIVEL